MNNTPTNLSPIYVLLINVNERQTAILSMTFKTNQGSRYQLITPDQNHQPNLILIDGIEPELEHMCINAQKQYPKAVVAVFSRNHPSFPTPYLQQPVRFDTLFTCLKKLVTAGSEAQTTDQSPSAPENKQNLSTIGSKAENNQSETPQNNTIEQRQRRSIELPTFSLDGSFLSLAQQLSVASEAHAISTNQISIVTIFPQEQKIHLHVNHETLQKIIQHPSTEYTTSISPLSSTDDLQLLPIQTFLWDTSIWTAQGRLVDRISPTAELKLKAWPNLTRLTPLPEATRLSAFLSKSPASVAVLLSLLPIDMHDLLNFISTTYLNGYLDVQATLSTQHSLQQNTNTTTLENPSDRLEEIKATDAKQQVTQPQGLLAKLMHRFNTKA